MMKLDFSKDHEVQDMICIIKKEKGLLPAEAIGFAVNERNYKSIMETGWASIALGMWGHGDSEREWDVLENPCVEVELGEKKYDLINKICQKEGVNTKEAIAYFLIFTMDSMGYHI